MTIAEDGKLVQILEYLFFRLPYTLIVEKIKRGFLWIYTFFLFFSALYQVVYVTSHANELLIIIAQITWIISAYLGACAIYSYLKSDNRLPANFWKGYFIVSLVLYILPIFQDASFTFVMLVLMFPTLYASYILGFNHEFHDLLALFREVNKAKYDEAIAQEKEKPKYKQGSFLKRAWLSYEWNSIKDSRS